MIRFLRDRVRVLITGAVPERCLNRFAAAGVAFRKPERVDELHFRCVLYQKDLKRAELAAARAMCTLTPEARFGIRVRFGGLLRRPVLVLGLLLAVVLTLLAQNYVWVVRIEGNELLSEAEIRRALTEEGIGFGTPGREIDSLLLRYRMQLRLPALRWLAANREGGVLTVQVAERKPSELTAAQTGAANLCAARDGVVTRILTENGEAKVAPGDAVRKGELLISGVLGWENRMQLVHAKGEVFALTRRVYRVKLPTETIEKREIGAQAREVSVLLGRKRIKIFGNSRISIDSCDKMVSRKTCVLPGGDALPLALEIVTFRFYETVPREIGEAEARAILEAFVLRDAARQMVAGTVRQAAHRLTKENGCWVLESELTCEEMISVTVPVRSLREDEVIGEADQRRTN